MDCEMNDAIIKDLRDNDLDLESVQLSQPRYPIIFDQESFTCSICQMVMFMPCVLPNCLHSFCRSCLHDWTKQGNNCPLCRAPFSDIKDSSGNIKITLIDINSQFLINRLPIQCPNNLSKAKKGSCAWKGTIEMAGSHLMKECLLDRVQCSNYGCYDKITPAEREEHELQLCAKRKVKCTQYCGSELLAGKITEHLRDECKFTFLQCNLCGGILQRMQYLNHQQSCKLTNAAPQCPYVEWGCVFSGTKAEYIQHSQVGCEFSTMICQKCFKMTSKRQQTQHLLKCQAIQLQPLLNDFKKQLILNNSVPNDPKQLFADITKSELARSMVQLQIGLSQSKADLLAAFSQFGPIVNMKEYLNLKVSQDKKVIVKYSHAWFANECLDSAGLHRVFSGAVICPMKTRKELTEQTLYLEAFPFKENEKVIDSLKPYRVRQVRLVSSQTDWKKGKMSFNFLLYFTESADAAACLKAQPIPNIKPHSVYEQILNKTNPAKQYDLDPYGPKQ